MDSNSTVTLNSGNKMPVLGLGTWKLNDNTADTIEAALKMGYKMIDTSGDYGTQPGIGQGLKQSGAKRDSYYLVTKVEEDDDAYGATKEDLHQLDLGYADLMLIHRPPSSGVGEVLYEGLQKARDEGLTRDVGVSNYSVDRLRELMDKTGETPAVNQIEWSAFGYSQEMLDFCEKNGIIIQAYSPLTRGERLDDETLKDIAAKHDVSPPLVLLRWCLQIGTVPIVKANQPDHMQQNLEVFDFELDKDDMRRLNGLNEEFSSLSSKPMYLKA